MKTTILSLLLALAVAGCASTPTDEGSVIKTTKKTDGSVETVENLSDYAAYAKTLTVSKPIFELTCPPQGCVFMSLTVNAPSDASKAAPPPDSQNVVMTRGFFNLAERVITGWVPFYYGASVLNNALGKANSSVTTTTNTDNSNRSVDSSNRSINTTTTTTTTNTNTNSNNRNCSTGSAGNGGTGAGGAGGAAAC